MGSFSFGYWLGVSILFAAVALPAAQVLRRTGHSPWLGLLYPLPLIGWVAFLVFAYSRWPRDDAEQAKPF